MDANRFCMRLRTLARVILSPWCIGIGVAVVLMAANQIVAWRTNARLTEATARLRRAEELVRVARVDATQAQNALTRAQTAEANNQVADDAARQLYDSMALALLQEIHEYEESMAGMGNRTDQILVGRLRVDRAYLLRAKAASAHRDIARVELSRASLEAARVARLSEMRVREATRLATAAQAQLALIEEAELNELLRGEAKLESLTNGISFGAAIFVLVTTVALALSRLWGATTPRSHGADSAQYARMLATETFFLLERMVPVRLTGEEFGDALELILCMKSRPRIYAKIASTVILILWHTAREKALATFSLKRGS